MNQISNLPELEYFCIWADTPKTEPKRGRKSVSFSDRYAFTGNAIIDGGTYRLQFVEHKDVTKLLNGVHKSRASHVRLYSLYPEAHLAQERTYFSPVIAKTGGRIGEPAAISDDHCTWFPYFVLSRNGLLIEIDFKGINISKPSEEDPQLGTIEHIQTLTTRRGEIIMVPGNHMRWVWRRPVPKVATTAEAA
ncbi:hypothetical protein H261_22893 [Paramagnetospirillum caucaseum]|uniref:Uncharacterized protein n=1 Tax=Paramagnetospirillum caucaseum TaxID=1244869 RepID=M2YZX8_9PROT|nr:hypothetical protein [Paramagnetospirillum caucaseum]EME67560.1 hypothetical protein H261_22893 [Paramagnetospirillum caucaseum]